MPNRIQLNRRMPNRIQLNRRRPNRIQLNRRMPNRIQLNRRMPNRIHYWTLMHQVVNWPKFMKLRQSCSQSHLLSQSLKRRNWQRVLGSA